MQAPPPQVLSSLHTYPTTALGADAAVTMFIGPSRAGEPLEVGVVEDDEGVAVIHAMRARAKFLKGWWTK